MSDPFQRPASSHKLIDHPADDGRLFVCGDLQGCYDELMAALDAAAFDRQCDQVLALGDLIDRGPKSFECLMLLHEPWFRSILGNHEDMMVRALNSDWDLPMWRSNGGTWFEGLTPDQQERVWWLVDDPLPRLPLGMTIVLPDGGKVGLIHGDPPHDWLRAVDGSHPRNSALWGRTRSACQDQSLVQNVDLVLVGHTPGASVLQLGNVYYLDTGAGYPDGRLTLLEIPPSLSALQQTLAGLAA
ncbi:metallophosphoesterase [Gimibacter soli]|uniref:Metallophosphoesterase n=1 Tax=Gimibacter soli TaxID=3024400 RepID=A0AAF0BIN0_9PROT|nr:metallophosphoesterase [Gimibacter soli]WCL55603.1 metallophosphoesterase [Gimibacter soli]